MDTWVWIVIACVVAAVVIIALAGIGMMRAQRRRSEELRGSFGPEYDRAVGDYGSQKEAEDALRDRRERVESLKLRDLSPAQREQFTRSWTDAQAQFVDEPAKAVGTASTLVDQAMAARGYPVGDFDQKAADISVDHPYVVQNYRAARDIARRNEDGEANTEDLRQAMVHYRGLFTELVNSPGDVPQVPDRPEKRRGDPRESMRRRTPRAS
jgi:hypothetical protein